MAGDEQDDNSKVGKKIIYHINFAEQQGIKKHISLFCFLFAIGWTRVLYTWPSCPKHHVRGNCAGLIL